MKLEIHLKSDDGSTHLVGEASLPGRKVNYDCTETLLSLVAQTLHPSDFNKIGEGFLREGVDRG